MNLKNFYAFRAQLADELERDVLGPAEPHEVLRDAPITRYVTGVLYPQHAASIDAEHDVDEADDDEAAGSDPPVALANVRYPASMGVTFAVDTAASDIIRVEVTAARYAPFESEEARAVRDMPTGDAGDEKGRTVFWKRIPLDIEPVDIAVDRPIGGKRVAVADGLALFWRIREADAEGHVSITLVLLNTRKAQFGERDADAIFQPKIRVTTPTGTAALVERRGPGEASDADLAAYRLLYRHARTFAVGHGCSVEWTIAGQDSGRAVTIESTFVPRHAVATAESNPAIRGDGLLMTFLARAERAEVVAALEQIQKGYAEWVNTRRQEIAELPEHLQETGREHINECAVAAVRIQSGIKALEEPHVWTAFQLANAAMLEQRARTELLRSRESGQDAPSEAAHGWRPFQLAFILQCLPGIVDAASDDRRIADLLWFPTGGGKTEAYLGLIAFSVFLRRLRTVDGGGVTAIMRYTLRLLTIQQFERAGLLICCCEAIRRQRTDLGDEEISIGLWVGGKATPNNLVEARSALNSLRSGSDVPEGNPCQVQHCPWCGTKLTHRHYFIDDAEGRLVIACGQPECEFGERLPIWVVDDDIYRARPTLLIATVDKFASMPWREEAAELFNLQTTRRPAQAPPELIVQDELHLISGPLGTLVGLYETVVDCVCIHQGAAPKVVASTATIRRAAEQTAGLFNRTVKQFPPPGLDARDSYFAVEAAPENRADRLYVGLTAPGTSHTTLLVRTYAALLQYAATLPGDDTTRDPYWTLVGYFNSLRVLGGARMQVQDDVTDRIRLLAAEVGHTPRELEQPIELTSREAAAKIPQHLAAMARTLGEVPGPVDVILATNMISVGVDVDRLGLMAVMGQPQSTSEYIQSTSRIGRQYPGFVAVLYNAAKSRDRSHYESFAGYHGALYRQVESTSVTPFSARARDRGLHAVVVALARLLIPALRANDSAAEIDAHAHEVRDIMGEIVARVYAVAPDEAEQTIKQVNAIVAEWTQRAQANDDLRYRAPKAVDALLVNAATDQEARSGALPTLWSLRDVDKEADMFLL